MKRAWSLILPTLVGLASLAAISLPSRAEPSEAPREVVDSAIALNSLGAFFGDTPRPAVMEAIDAIEDNWNDGLYAPLIEITGLSSNQTARQEIFNLLERRTGETHGDNFQAWYAWLWNRPEYVTPDYADFKALIYAPIDEAFRTYFDGRLDTARIRLDEIRWGGVRQDGIPPLRQPDMISAREADYLADTDIVFGLEVNGDARAYPKRILAWHEMFVDTIGGVEIAGVYCTLCGTVIPYKTRVDGTNYELGTSGFLYRSNKLMYDRATQSLWSTMRGEPVVGPLVDQGIKMEFTSIVTTNWGEWKRRHPDTQVLSLSTGHQRDYGEGVAYREYFATDQLMFNTPYSDARLDNKREVLGLRFPGAPNDQLAIDSEFLKQNPVHTEQIGLQDIVILTDASGSHRVYDPKGVTFIGYDGDRTLEDSDGTIWTLNEDQLSSDDGRQLPRLPAHRAFWFGWHSAFPETRLVN